MVASRPPVHLSMATVMLDFGAPDGKRVFDLTKLWERHPEQRRAITVGRFEPLDGNGKPDIELEGRLASRSHAFITFDGYGFHIEDRSANGTCINGEKMARKTSRPLKHGDTLEFADPKVLGSNGRVDKAVVQVITAGIPKSLKPNGAVRRASVAEPPPSTSSYAGGGGSRGSEERRPKEPSPPPNDRDEERPPSPPRNRRATLVPRSFSAGVEGAEGAGGAGGGARGAGGGGRSGGGFIGPAPPPAAGAAAQEAQPFVGPQPPPAQAQGYRREAPVGPQLPPGAAPHHHSSSSSGATHWRGGAGRSGGPHQSGAGGAAGVGPRGTKRPLEAAEGNGKGKRAKCDKCDGPHETDACPHFKKSRENHKDAWLNYGRKHPLTLGTDGGKLAVRGGRVIRQPGDGSCLFHSLCFGLYGGGRNSPGAQQLRRQLAEFIQKNPRLEIAGDTLEEWVKWDSQSSVSQYTRRMAVSGWGGGIEMAACSILNKVNVHVYEARRNGCFERISCFQCPQPTKRTVNVCYQGGMHFDALVVNVN